MRTFDMASHKVLQERRPKGSTPIVRQTAATEIASPPNGSRTSHYELTASAKIDGHRGWRPGTVDGRRGPGGASGTSTPPCARRDSVEHGRMSAGEQRDPERRSGGGARVAVLGQARQDDGLQIAGKRPAQALGRSQRLLEQVLAAHLRDGRSFEHVLAGQQEICDGAERVDI